MKEFLNKNKRAIIMIFLVAGLILYNVNLYRQAAENKKKAEIAEYNLTVANDTIRIIKDRAGKIEYSKLAYLTNNVESLKKMNQELANEIKNIKGKVSTIIQSQIKIVEKPVPFLVRGELIDSNIVAHFNYDTVYSLGNYKKLSGFTKYNLKDGTAIGIKEKDEIGIKFVTGIKNLDKNKPEIFLKSDYPGFQVTSLEGSQLDPKIFQPKVKTPLITPVIAIGYSPIVYNGLDQRIYFSPNSFSITAGLGLNIFKILGVKK